MWRLRRCRDENGPGGPLKLPGYRPGDAFRTVPQDGPTYSPPPAPPGARCSRHKTRQPL
ncbi:hypothetical protein SBRY_20196 [Actinacidiphila bryophytorum]|uniref:Uncharacterized protein n=1 Tax=Actinacidiphila bryophytorum TaxID=1436133 RepID=A0A9W4E731_9ACTN|nr:hypothetical protein SBRY_20196 [Actinacidiphila bryophytorum]